MTHFTVRGKNQHEHRCDLVFNIHCLPIRNADPVLPASLLSETARSSSLLMELSLKKVPEGREQLDPVANDLRDCEHRYRQDAPGTPHIQYQKISAMMTRSGLSVKRRANSMGVMVSPSARWIKRYSPAGNKAGHNVFAVSSPANVNITTPIIGPRTGM